MRPPTQYPQEVVAQEAEEEPDPRLGAMMICTRLAGRAVIRVIGRCDEAKENENLGESDCSNRVDPAQTPAIDFEEIVQEVNDRQSRKNNLIIYGIVESTDQSDTRRKVYDADQVKNIIGVLDDEVNTDNIKPIRLGSNNTGGPRPIKITLRDSNDVRSCIKAAAKLKRHSTLSRINISFDRTPRQVLNYKKLKQEVADRSANGENDLSNCQLMQVPDAVYHLMRHTELKTCDLSENDITKIPPKFAEKFNLITDLNLSHNQMAKLPDNCPELGSLERLDISYNTFISMPDCIFKIPKLRYLNASNNHIVETVDLTNNPLAPRIHDQLSKITNIRILLTPREKEDWEDLTI
nr:unnamed protein product [Callosobruchus analis]